MPQYKLTYFNLAALAEPIRWTLKVAGVEFEDERIEFADWPELKASGRCPAQQLPLFEIDGEVFTQATAILKYLGRKFGLEPEDELLKLRVDQVIDILTDARIEFRIYLVETDEEKKEKMKAELISTKLPLFLAQVEAIVSKTEGNYITGSKLTVGDLFLANWAAIFGRSLGDELVSKFPAVSKLRDTVLAIPEIDAWIKVRPDTFI